MLHCGLRVRWKVASDLRFRAAISEPKTSSFCRTSGDLAPSTRRSLAIAMMRFWCAKHYMHDIFRCSKLEPFCDTEKWAHLANLGGNDPNAHAKINQSSPNSLARVQFRKNSPNFCQNSPNFHQNSAKFPPKLPPNFVSQKGSNFEHLTYTVGPVFDQSRVLSSHRNRSDLQNDLRLGCPFSADP